MDPGAKYSHLVVITDNLSLYKTRYQDKEAQSTATMAQISDYLVEVCSEVIKAIRSLLASNSLEGISHVVLNIKLKLEDILAAGCDALEPGGLGALTAWENRVASQAAGNGSSPAAELLQLIVQCFKEEWKSPLVITLNVELCRVHLTDIKVITSKADALIVCSKILDAVGFIISNYKTPVQDPVVTKTSTILLCLNQIKNILPLFVTGVEKDSALIQNYSANCLMACLERIQKECCDKSILTCSEFIDLMDSALSHLDELTDETGTWMASSSDKMKSLKTLVDELLCHSMSMAQVCVTESDRQNILGKAQTILRSMEALKDALAGDDVPTVRLAAQVASNALCSLERGVNSAVLRLVLHVSSGVQDPLCALVEMCRLPQTTDSLSSRGQSRKASNLDDLIMEFDSHMDRLMQIGTFAVSCSSNVKNAMQLRSCLASFESLEAELVPCVTALYLDPTKQHKRNLRLLIDHWLQGSITFLAVLDTIVDPAAYADVVKEYIKGCIQELDQSGGVQMDEIIERAVKAARTLKGVVQTTIKQDCSQNVVDITLLAQRVTKAVEHCERLQEKLKKSELPVASETVFKGTRALETAVDNLWEFLVKKVVELELSEAQDSIMEADNEEESIVTLPTAKNYYQLCPTDVEMTPAGSLDCLLTPHLAKARMLVKESVLYNTPKRSTLRRTPVPKTPMMRSTVKKSHMKSVTRSRCFRSAAPKVQQPSKELSDMELTALLDDLSRLDSTFSMDETLLPRKETEFQGRRLLNLFAGWDSLLETTPDLLKTSNETEGTTMPSSIMGNNNYETPERVMDLLKVEAKIENLKLLNQ